MRVLVNTPSLKRPGGVANHYIGLRPFWTEQVEYNTVGRRNGVPAFLCLVYDYFKFICLLLVNRYELVVLNPSLGKTAVLRDSIFLTIAKACRTRCVVFFHGWDSLYETIIDSNPHRFTNKFKAADAFIVLANDFVGKMRSWGIISPIYVSTTKVDDRLVAGVNLAEKRVMKTVLFLARLEISKGILIALEAFSRVSERHPDARIVVAGAGGGTMEALELVDTLSIPNVVFLGNVSGSDLRDAYQESDIYILPTTHGEGMPTSVLEAMAFGLPIITRPVGGLVDFFEDGKMGFISSSLDPTWFADAMEKLFEDEDLAREMAIYNHAYARRNFLASKVARRLEQIFRSI